ncbi:unnamed protein product [Paramecium octaurelia]|uniref:Uncharacterized protein n=1 Tax=Paramecium octaurelia TaxID=43137 RepID=A0A8S1SDU1_PAROT|nr:unnamed protein product [Paramecium octaurelia]
MINPNRKQTPGNQFYQCFLNAINLEMLPQQYNKKNIVKIKSYSIKKKPSLAIQHQKNKINRFRIEYQISQQYLQVEKINSMLPKYLLEQMTIKKIPTSKTGTQNLIPFCVVLQDNSVQLKNKSYLINHLVQKNNKNRLRHLNKNLQFRLQKRQGKDKRN